MMSPEEALTKAKIKVMSKKSTFIIYVLFNLQIKYSDKVLTAGTDGKQILINKDWFMTLSTEARAGLLVHEAWHVALNHLTRGKDKDPQLYNSAGDYVINLLVTDAGYQLPADGLFDHKYRGWSTEQVYDDLLQNNPEQQPMFNDLLPADDELEDNVRQTVIKAVTQAKMSNQHGSIPAEVLVELDKLINPLLPWENLLHQFLNNLSKEDYSYRRPNRKYFPNWILPGTFSEKLANLTIAIDTSGSVTKNQLTEMLSEIRYIHEVMKPDELVIIDCDTHIHNIHTIDDSSDITELVFEGRGGTEVTPVFDYCNKNNPTALLYFTDGYFNCPEVEPNYPLLWILYSDVDPLPIGESIYYRSKALIQFRTYLEKLDEK